MSAIENMEAISGFSVITDPAELHTLASNSSRSIRHQVASNSQTRAETLDMLAREETPLSEIHVAIANHENTSMETLTHLYKKASGSRIGNFFKYLYTPYDSITIKPINEDILLVLCRNSNTPVEVLTKLAKSRVFSVKLEVTHHPKLPLENKVEVLCGFIADRKNGGHSENRAFVAIDHPDLPENIRDHALAQIVAEGYKDIWRQLASFNYLNEKTVIAFLESGDETVRENLVQNTRLPEESYALLPGEPESEQVDEFPASTKIQKYSPDLSSLRHAERFKESSIYFPNQS